MNVTVATRLLLTALILSLAACTSPSTRIKQRENLLAASGFTIRATDSPRRKAMIATLPVHHFVERMKNGKPIFLYYDPSICDCLFIGNDVAYDNYQKAIYDRQTVHNDLADQSSLIKESRSDYNEDLKITQDEVSADEWDWGPWGPGWW